MQEKILPDLPVQIPHLGSFDYAIVFWATIVAILVALLGWCLGRKLQKCPGRRQAAAEMLVGWFDALCRDMLGKNRGRKYLPLFGTLFLFVTVSNIIGLFPLHEITFGAFPAKGLEIGGESFVDFNDDGLWQPGEPVADEDGRPDWEKRTRRMGMLIPPVTEPTRSVNGPMGLSLFLAAGMYGAAVLIKGIGGFGKSLFEPMWFMFPLNLVGMVAEIVSVSFRLFGNIFGGAVIIIVVGQLLHEAVMPVSLVLRLFVGLFVGVIQAFVFTMLWMTYHANHIAEEG